MALIPIQLPPGVFKNGTELQAAGRWYDANLVRWFEGTIRPVGGWRQRTANQLTGLARGIQTWRDNTGDRWIAIGTHSKLYAMNEAGSLADITPAGFVVGDADAIVKLGYGYSTYGSFSYGTARPDLSAVQPATTWSLDTWGENLIGCSSSDGKLYEWALDFSTPTVAAAITNAPTSCASVMATAERFVFALGAGGNPRKVAWCDQENNTVWTPSSTNQAGDFELSTPGTLMSGRRVRGANLLWTTIDVHQSSYIGQPFIFSFEKIGSGCGLLGPNSVVALDTMAFWMSKSGFWMYDGYVKPLQCDVGDFVFTDINMNQASKTYGFHNSEFGEVWWLYPSSASNEVDAYVSYNYRENHWSVGKIDRTCAVPSGVFSTPLMVSPSGYVYEHETGSNYDGQQQYAESGPYQLGTGDAVISVTGMIPDESTIGDTTVTFKAKFYPTGEESTYGPFATANPTDLRFTARQLKMRLDVNEARNWRLGTMRLDGVQGGRR